MAWVIPHAGQSLNQDRHARKGPQVRVKPVRAGSLPKRPLDPPQVRTFNSRLAAGTPRSSQRPCAALLPFSVPATHTLATYAEHSSNIRQNQLASSKQTTCFLSPPPKPLKVPPRSIMSVHVLIVSQRSKCVTLLCEIL